MKVNFLIVSFLILLSISCINVSAAATDGWDVTWTPIKNSIIDKEYRIEVQNLQDVKRNVNICSFFDETNFPIYKMKDIEFYEWKLLPYNYTINHYDHINYSEYICNELNSTCYWYNRTKNILNYTEIIESEKLDWKECKSLLFTSTLHNLKNNYGLINIPKAGSKDTGDGTYNGTKVFLLKWKTPIVNTGNRFGSSGKVAVLLDSIEYHPYWNTSFSTRKEIILTGNTSGAQTDYQILLNVTYETEMQNDFDDLRFTNDTHEIDSWLESKVDGSYALVWVEFPTTPANGVNQTYYMYYGNAGVANNWDGAATFPELFDDFEDNDVSDWTTEAGATFVTVSDPVKHGNYAGNKTGTGTAEAYKTFSNINERIFEFYARVTQTTYSEYILIEKTGSDSANSVMFRMSGGNIQYMDGSYHTLQTHNINQWYKFKVTTHASSRTFDVDIDGVNKGNGLSDRGDISAGLTAFSVWSPSSAILYIDDVFARKYAANPPTYTYGSIIYAETFFIPPTPITLANTTGNFWITHTWAAGSGNVTDGYNVSVNTVWHNTTNTFYTNTYSANAWQNITVWAYNLTGIGTMSEGNVSQNTQAPSEPVIVMITQLGNIFAAIILTVKAIFNLIIDVFPFIIAMIFLSSFAYLIGRIFGRRR